MPPWLVRRPQLPGATRCPPQSSTSPARWPWSPAAARGWARRWPAASPRPAPTSSSPAGTRTSCKAALDEILDGTGRRASYVVADMSKRDEVDAAGRRRPRARWAGSTSWSTTPAPTCRRPIDADHRRDLGPDAGAEPHLGDGPDAGRRAADEGAPLGPDHPHLVDHGLRVEGEAQRLLGDQGGADRPGPGQRPRPGAVRHHGQLHRPGAVPDRPAGVRCCPTRRRRRSPTARPWAAGASRRSWSARRCCWPATPAATSPAQTLVVDGGYLAR